MEASALHLPQGLTRIAAAGPLLRLRSDDQLVALFRMGYDDAFRVIHDRYRQRLFAYTRQMLAGSRSDAEDALPAPVDLFDVSRQPLHDPLLEAERREDLRRLVEDVRRLPEQQRSALLMRELEGLSYAELSDALNITIPAVKSVLVRARLGLVEASDARDTACADIRSELTLAFDRGVRASGRSRRHLRDCAGCRDYRQALRGAQAGLGALSPGAGPLATIAKLLGLGGAGSGAAAGGTVAASGGGAGAAAAGGCAASGGGLAASAGTGAAVAAGSAATVTATKVAAIVGAAAVVGGGAAEVKTKLLPHERHATPPAQIVHAAPPTASAPGTASTAVVLRRRADDAAERRAEHADTAKAGDGPAQADDAAGATPTDTPGQSAALSAPSETELRSGGVAAPEEPPAPQADAGYTDPALAPGQTGTPGAVADAGTAPPGTTSGAHTASASEGGQTTPAPDAHAAAVPGTQPAPGQAPAAATAP